ncbi:MAG: NADH-quinone oxidoreductase subunit L [Bacteroidales bacterium]|nr:NADH-quinone oxidoreductase subunit L [Bacteroidales bacterium]MDD3907102.1 NADH-quinone oxidoreductase subunit L [Bacteroidales bacterium]MDD4711879.1 NADH-quinone oxidoreductase subunit L [Bacteroidales bacterium]
MSYTLIIVALPFLMFLFLGLVGGKMKPVVAGLIGTIGLIISTVLSYIAAGSYFFSVGKIGETYQTIVPMNFEWLRFTDKLHIDLGIMLDPISVMMLVVITTVSLMVHIYSFGYMKGERGFQRYYALLSLFSFSMLGLVIAPNIFQMYIFWELVGVSSYSLIGFYYTKPSAVAASKKAFIVTRFADLFFLIGILVLSFYSGTFSFQDLTSPAGCAFAQSITDTFMGWSVVSWAMMLIFIGGAGKSAMLPFHIWLPDAMEGPTPVSALIHAATMVVAGVFLVARMFPVYIFGAPDVLTIITYIGATTALFAAVIACTQTDIKRVLAFSTISQIAYMITALGVSGYGAHEGLGYMASMFHLFTHAFFKALLFLGAGAVIHAVHSNEMDSMGGLRKYLPITNITFLIACLSISGIPPFSGFFSKDEILVAAFEKNQIVFWCLYFCAGLTAFYMFRLYYRIFWGDNNKVYQHTPHEAPASMTIPLIFLAALTCVVGFIPFSEFISTDKTVFHTHIEWSIASLSILVAVTGIAIATWMYRKKNTSSDKVTASIKGLYTAAYHKFYFDEIWIFVTKKIIFNGISKPVAWFDRHVVDGFMNLQSTMTNYLSRKIKFTQSGEIQDYAWAFMMGAVVIISLLVFI